MNNSNSYDSEAIFRSALNYLLASNVLHRKLTVDRETNYIWPTFVNLVFSLELFLKCLLVIEGTSYKTNKGKAPHGLKTLFDLLSPQSKSEIGRYFNQLVPRIPLPSELQGSIPPDADTVEYVLEQSNEAFAKLRYLFEGRHNFVPISDIGPAIFGVRSRIEDLKPEYKKMK